MPVFLQAGSVLAGVWSSGPFARGSAPLPSPVVDGRTRRWSAALGFDLCQDPGFKE